MAMCLHFRLKLSILLHVCSPMVFMSSIKMYIGILAWDLSINDCYYSPSVSVANFISETNLLIEILDLR